MFELLVLASFKSHAIVAALALVGGGVLGFLYGSSVERKAAGLLSKAGEAANSASQKI